jgi:hypothetical protein
VQKEFSIREKVHCQFRVDAFNAFNHTQFTGYNSTVNFGSLTNWNPTNLSTNNLNGFGTVNGVASARNLQTVIRIQF